MKRITFFTCIVLCLVLKIQAQNFDGDSVYYTPIPKTNKVHSKSVSLDSIKNEKRISYFFNLQMGSLIGCNECEDHKEITFSSSTIHGITIDRKLRVGAGLGFDTYYSWHTMPIFGSVSWDMFGSKSKNALFLQFDYGWSKPWLNKTNQDYGFKDVSGGRMSLAQIGYRIKYHDVKIAIAIGSKFQRVNAYYEYPTYYYLGDGTIVEGEPSTKSIQESMSRLMFSLIVGWK